MELNVDLKFNQAELAKLDTMPELEQFVAELGREVAKRANAKAERLFNDRLGGGVGSVESHLEHDDRGTFARVGYPRQFFYMNIHEVGSEHERPRPHLRPALFATKRGTGGKDSAITRVKQDKAAQRATKRNRATHKARKA